ncbi:MAG: hypothetical protein M3O86_02355, partial [Actinomycetota bacterium]|nr:hypothetical protein [Actinomycetota bacterium]
MGTVRAELYRVSRLPPDALWAVVGNPWRLAEWTDAERVESVAPEPLAVGSEIVTVEAGDVRTWRAGTVAPRLLELTTTLPRGELGVGFRVALD